jgi:hypothetical protein
LQLIYWDVGLRNAVGKAAPEPKMVS